LKKVFETRNQAQIRNSKLAIRLRKKNPSVFLLDLDRPLAAGLLVQVNFFVLLSLRKIFRCIFSRHCSNACKKSHIPKMFNPGRIARVSAIATSLAILSAQHAFADADDRNQQILPFQTITASTIPSNGDVNPYGVAFVPPDSQQAGN
jgi:hypothetical protein